MIKGKIVSTTPKSKQSSTLIVIDKAVKPLIAKSQNLLITNETSLKEATELLSQSNIVLKELTTQYKVEAEPYQTPLDLLSNQYDPSLKALKSLIKTLRESLGEYQTNVESKRLEAESRIAERVLKGNIKPETGVRKIDELEAIPDQIRTDSGSLSFRPTPTLLITNPLLIPREYLVADESKILTALKVFKKVAGCEIRMVSVPVNRRN